MKQSSFDDDCYTLAKDFLTAFTEELDLLHTELNRRELAILIQKTIDSYLNDLEEKLDPQE